MGRFARADALRIRAASLRARTRQTAGSDVRRSRHRELRHRRRDPLRRGNVRASRRTFGATRTGSSPRSGSCKGERGPLRLLTRQSGKARPRVLLAPRARALLASQRAAPQSVPDPALLIGDEADSQPPPDGREAQPVGRKALVAHAPIAREARPVLRRPPAPRRCPRWASVQVANALTGGERTGACAPPAVSAFNCPRRERLRPRLRRGLGRRLSGRRLPSVQAGGDPVRWTHPYRHLLGDGSVVCRP